MTLDTTALILARLQRVAGLASFGGGAAAFADRVPDGWMFGADPAPCAVVAAPLEDAGADLFDARRRLVRQEVRLYAPDAGSRAALDAAAAAVRAAFDAQEAALSAAASGATVVVATVAGPLAQATTNAAVQARRLELRLLIEEDS